jgi:hypothetical protein
VLEVDIAQFEGLEQSGFGHFGAQDILSGESGFFVLETDLRRL